MLDFRYVHYDGRLIGTIQRNRLKWWVPTPLHVLELRKFWESSVSTGAVDQLVQYFKDMNAKGLWPSDDPKDLPPKPKTT